VAIGEAMVRRDRTAVEELMRRHIQQVRDYVLSADGDGRRPAAAPPA
jgi:DNA-binding GntR family transcriptional regulator